MSPTAWRGRLAAFGDAVRFAPPASATALSSLEGAQMASQNREFRTHPDFRRLYMPFDLLLFFGAAGNGDQFFYRMTDSRTWRAASLATFLPSVLEETAEP
jgi:hypothetical protein